MADLKEQIEETATGPASVTVDGTTVTAQPLEKMIEADRYLAAKVAATKKHRGLRFTKLVPGGST